MLKSSLIAVAGVALLLGACESQTTQAITAPPPAPATAPSYMVFFDWDRADLSQQALVTIAQAADAYKRGGTPVITTTGHTDTSGPADYNMALSLRRANAVKNALVQNGVPATQINVVGKGETQLLVPTADGVREPQNRRVEITGFASLTSQVGIGVFKDPYTYCKALSDAYRQYRGNIAENNVSAAIAKCEEGNTAEGIPWIENALIQRTIPLPSPGYRWPGQPITPNEHV
jgi:hypothetical protein